MVKCPDIAITLLFPLLLLLEQLYELATHAHANTAFWLAELLICYQPLVEFYHYTNANAVIWLAELLHISIC